MNAQKQILGLIMLLGLAFILFTCQTKESPNEEPQDTTTIVIPDLPLELNIDDIISAGRDTQVTFNYDAVFKEPITFKGVALLDLLEANGVTALKQPDSIEVAFLCVDGYKPTISLAEILKNEAYITYQKTEEQLSVWPEELKDKAGPYYLSWQGVTADDKMPYPYGVYAIKVSMMEASEAAAFPDAILQDSLLMAGSTLFKEKCMKCHSVNRVGGNLGPEFNIPKNITEYRSKSFMYAFANSPQSFRYNSKMAPMALEEQEFNQIYAYLETMKGYKVD